MKQSDETTQPCFGNLDTVFPMGEDGLRITPDNCLACDWKTECLRAAMSRKEGLTVQEERIDRAYATGMIGFLGRWSRKKMIHAKRRNS
jgi:hypothetical protein